MYVHVCAYVYVFMCLCIRIPGELVPRPLGTWYTYPGDLIFRPLGEY